jgi:hypothetical protein
MEELKNLFEFLGKRKFIETFSTLDADGGIQNRISGKGTNPRDKKTQPSPEEVVELKKAWKAFVRFGDKVMNKL